MKTLTTAVLLFTTLFTSIDVGAQVRAGKSNEPIIQISNDEGESLITWTTNKEVNTSYFLLEVSTDSIHFTTIKTLEALGNSLFGNTYEHVEISSNPDSYYRVTLVDMNGARSSSDVVKNASSITDIAGK